jgi:hypothetical protein
MQPVVTSVTLDPVVWNLNGFDVALTCILSPRRGFFSVTFFIIRYAPHSIRSLFDRAFH